MGDRWISVVVTVHDGEQTVEYRVEEEWTEHRTLRNVWFLVMHAASEAASRALYALAVARAAGGNPDGR